MTPLQLINLIMALGPVALDLAPRLAAIFTRPSLTPEEVLALCAPARKSYDDYIREARAAQVALPLASPVNPGANA